MTITEQLDQIAARAERATEGPWDICGATHVWSPAGKANVASASEPQGRRDVGYEPPDYASGGLHQAAHNATFIAAARSDVPALVKALRFCITQSNVYLPEVWRILSERPEQ